MCLRINWSLLAHFKNEEGSCIIISRMLASGSADRLRAQGRVASMRQDEAIASS